jgi:diguanylate cyclase (GGDEF)-like protein
MTHTAELARLRRELHQARGLVAVQAQVMEADQDPTEVMNVVVAGAAEVVRADGAVVELADGADMVYAAVAGLAAGRLGLRLAAVGSLSGRCVLEAQALHCADSETDARVDRDACRVVGARSMVVVPLLVHGRCLGVLKVYAGEPGVYDDADIQAVEQLASFIARALRRADDFAASRYAALHDPLTGLANRALLFDRLQAAMAGRRRSEGLLAVAYVDLDRFKEVNDTAGHAAGDALLVDTAGRLLSAVRDKDTVARLGGDEFVVVCTGELSADLLGERLRHVLLLPEPISATIGTVAAVADDTPATLLARADAAMYAGKAGRSPGVSLSL